MPTLLGPRNNALLSARDWLMMGETHPHSELVKGRVVKKPLKTYCQVKALGSFFVQCSVATEELGWNFLLEGTGVYVSDQIVYIPDIVGFAPGVELKRYASMITTPFLAVEVISRATATKDRAEKSRNYARIGVQMDILIDPDQKTLEVFRLDGNRYGTAEVLRDNDIWKPSEIEGLELRLEKLWM